MPDEDTDERLAAHRAAFAALALVIEETAPGAFESIIAALATFEAGMRQQNAADAAIAEIRHIREGLESMRGALPSRDPKMPPPPPEGEPGPSAPSGPTS